VGDGRNGVGEFSKGFWRKLTNVGEQGWRSFGVGFRL
jgi:hypothetical protein